MPPILLGLGHAREGRIFQSSIQQLVADEEQAQAPKQKEIHTGKLINPPTHILTRLFFVLQVARLGAWFLDLTNLPGDYGRLWAHHAHSCT